MNGALVFESGFVDKDDCISINCYSLKQQEIVKKGTFKVLAFIVYIQVKVRLAFFIYSS